MSVLHPFKVKEEKQSGRIRMNVVYYSLSNPNIRSISYGKLDRTLCRALACHRVSMSSASAADNQIAAFALCQSCKKRTRGLSA